MDFGAPTLLDLMDIEECARLCTKHALQFIELNMTYPQYQAENIDVEKLLEIKSRYGIYYTLHLEESLDPCSVNAAVRKAYTDTVLWAAELAKALDIPVLNMHLARGEYVTQPDKRVYIYGENSDWYLARMREFRDTVTAAIGESDIKICIENTDGYDLPYLRSAIELLLESPIFMLTYDVGHDHAINNIDLPFITGHAERLCHMHLHDAVGERVHLALGEGEIDLDRFLAMAKEHNCRVVLETKTPEALKTSAAWAALWKNRHTVPDELWDVYTPDRQKTGRLHRRCDLLTGDDCHLCVHVWIKNSRGEFLLTRRDEAKSYGGMWEAPGGCAVAGDDSLTAALREIREETGFELKAENGRIVHDYGGKHFFCDIWLFEQDFDLSRAVLQKGETTDIMYASPDEIRRLYAENKFVGIPYIEDVISL